jgi:hypothetical protein
MKLIRTTAALLSCALLITLFASVAFATNMSEHYDFIISADGGSSATVTVGDTVTVTVSLARTRPGNITMYALQERVIFDDAFFELVPGSLSAPMAGVTHSTQAMTGAWAGWTGVNSNALSSRAEGDAWENPAALVTFQLKTLKTGTSAILHREHKMSTTNGMDEYDSAAKNATVIIKSPQTTPTPTPSSPPGGGGATDPDVTEVPGKTPAPTPTPTPSEPPPARPLPFDDVPDGAWYYDAVAYVVNAGLFNGVSAAEFAPERSMTRAMFVTVLGRLAGIDAARFSGSGYADVPASAWYAPYVAWASENAVVGGMGDGTFAPNAPVTREQLAVMLYRYAMSIDKGQWTSDNFGTLDGFTDADGVSAWARDALQWAVGAKIVNGMGDGRLNPKGTSTRAQVAQVLYNSQTALS